MRRSVIYVKVRGYPFPKRVVGGVEQHGEFVRIIGRESEQINVGGEKVFPVEVETVLLECPLVVDAVVLNV